MVLDFFTLYDKHNKRILAVKMKLIWTCCQTAPLPPKNQQIIQTKQEQKNKTKQNGASFVCKAGKNALYVF
jgi:outer membrane biogenesis lipoprotein LolB